MWGNRNVWIILIGEFIAGVGLWTGIIGNLEFMQEKVPSDFLKSLILATGLLAGILIGPLAGKITDLYRKKTVMLYSGFLRTVSVLFMFVAISSGSVWWMVAFMITIQISAAFYFPALQSAIPLIVQDNELLQMNGVHMNVATISRIIGTALAGALLTVLTIFMLYFISFLAYLVLFFLTFLLKMEEKVVENNLRKSKGDNKKSFKEVLPVIKSTPIVLMTLILTLVPLLFLGGFNLMVINISEIYDSSSIKGVIYAAEGLAFMLGAFIVKKVNQKWSPYSILFLFSFIIGFAQLSLFFVELKYIMIASFAIFGFSLGCFFPTAATIFQTKVLKEFHGRFFSFRNMLDRIGFQVVLLSAGFMLDLIGLQWMVVVFGLLSLIITAIFFTRYRKNNEVTNNKAKAVSF
ncbi:MFS transporter [Bacillus kwashiorkori]|uniref:MFS transporter n=1 Tax=Bacillus kwashiorkori TaxID=1522318 RepID=UPI000784C8DD|nr:MFS transporter [Bacillus kwashiorkori]